MPDPRQLLLFEARRLKDPEFLTTNSYRLNIK
jgi:hypothetical protein